MSTITILEGADGSGKTHLRTVLKRVASANEEPVVVIHHGPYPGVGTQELCMRYLKSMDSALSRGLDVVLDRSWLSEPIYAKVHRDLPSRITSVAQAMLERAALAANAVVVLCRPPLSTCIANFCTRRDEEILASEIKLAKVYSEYGRMATCLPVVAWDYTQDNLFDLDLKIEVARGPRNQGPGAGAWKPGKVVVLVGEKANVSPLRSKEAVVLPFISFANVGCSSWLTEQLIKDGISEDQLYWINAVDQHGVPCDSSFLTALKPKRVIAMGRVAQGWCMLNKVSSVNVPHPMHTKRFAMKEGFDVIANKIREVFPA